jgi:hypothetical protein
MNMLTDDSKTFGMRWLCQIQLALAFGVALVFTAPELSAHSDAEKSAASDTAAAAGQKLSNPLSDVWALFTEFDATYSDGDLTDGHRNGSAMIFQPIMPFEFSKNWKMITRPTVPVVFTTDVPVGRRWSTSPLSDDSTTLLHSDGTAHFDSKQGLGDISVPMMFSPKVPGRAWGWGLGPTWTFPTATTDELGHDTWQVGPAAVWTYHSPDWALAVLGQYWWNFAEEGSDTPDTSHGTVLYSVWRNLPNAWQVGFNPTITYNNEAVGGDKWNVPIGMGFAKTLMFGKTPVKFQFSVEKSVVRADDFGADWKVRLNIIPVIPSLQSGTFF